MPIDPVHNLRRTMPDGRTDDGCRTIMLARDVILIERQVAGVRMRVRIPVAAYVGLTIARRTDRGGAYAIILGHRDPALCVVIETAADFATLRERLPVWSQFFGTPVILGRSRPGGARRRGVTRARRPRFLARRTRPMTERACRRFAHEDEIICYE